MIYKLDNVEKIVMDKTTALKLEKKGFVCIAEDEETTETASAQESEADLNNMTVKELRNLAKARGIKGAGALSKGDLLQVLQ